MRFSFGLHTVSAKAISLIVVMIIISIAACAAFILNHFNKLLGTDRLEENLAAAEQMINPDQQPYSLENGVLKVGDHVLNNDNATTDNIARVFHGSMSIAVGRVRVATSNKKADGTRAVGTKIGAEVADKVYSSGKVYSGATVVAGEPHLSAYMPLKDTSGKIVGILAVGYITTEFMKTFYDAVTLTCIAGLGLIILCGGLGYFVFRYLFAPFKPLSELMSDAQKGRYTTDVPYTERKDEFGTLAEVILQFNQSMKAQEAQRIKAEEEKKRATEEQKLAEIEAQRRSEALVVETFGEGLKAMAEERLDYRLNANLPPAYQALKDNFNQAMETSERNRREREQAAKQREIDRAKAEEAQKQAEETARLAGIELVVSSFGEGLDAMAQRNLTYRLTKALPEEYRVLQQNFNDAIGQLEGAMRDINKSANDIATNCHDISEGAHGMASRTERQAASLEETAAAVNEITATVGKSADSAAQASQRAIDAKKGAEHGNSIASLAVDAMREIAKSSGEISNIIGVIDEIAFQTNLLALNAGVEAARAGEAGRGFAVVASEVRALAQRSAEAAREIKKLIKASETQVETGVKLVEESGGALQKIVEDVASISTLVGEIAHSQREQANALGEIDSAVSDMDKSTQQNAAMAEESNAASEALAGYAKEMESMVGRFTITH
ncbi:MAG: methyl-accepting chemotaxis protein [Rhizomicrobium sp.]